MPSMTPYNQNLEEWARQYQNSWELEFQKKKEIWDKKLTHEQRVKYIMSVFNRIATISKNDPLQAGVEMLKWIRSPDGALAWPYIWKPEYRQRMIQITFHAMNVIHKLLIKNALRQGINLESI